MEFRWNEWNLDHVPKHGVTPDEAEFVVRHAKLPYPRRHGEDKWLVWGRGNGGRFVQVVFVVGDDDTVYIIHAKPLTEREKQRYRRRKRRHR